MTDKPLQLVSDNAQHPALDSAEAAIAAIGRGELIVVVDDEDRENEGDLIVASDHATEEAINYMITYGRGLVCVTITEERAEELGLPPMVEHNEDYHGTAFTVSVDGGPQHGVTTGISAWDRSKTVQLCATGKKGDLNSPGHMFPLIARPGGLVERPGHTEAGVDLAREAGCSPSGVIVEIINPDGTMSRFPQLLAFAREQGLVMTSIEKLREYFRAKVGASAQAA